MGQRFLLFHTGFSASVVMLYYELKALCNECGSHPSETARNCVPLLGEWLNREVPLRERHLTMLSEAVVRLNLKTVPPVVEDSYPEWQPILMETCEKQYPMTRIEYYYFFYGRKLADVRAHISLASCYLFLQTRLGNELNLPYRFDKALRDCEFDLFKMTAPSTLLASEFRHGFFSQHHKALSEAFNPLKEVTSVSLVPDKIGPTIETLKAFSSLVDRAFDNCHSSLQALSV